MRSFALALLCAMAVAPLPVLLATPATAQLVEPSASQMLAQVSARLAAANTTVNAATPFQLQQAVGAEVRGNPGSAPGMMSALTDVVTPAQLEGARRGALDGIGAAVQSGRINRAVGQRLAESVGPATPGPRGRGSFPPMSVGRGAGYLN